MPHAMRDISFSVDKINSVISSSVAPRFLDATPDEGISSNKTTHIFLSLRITFHIAKTFS